MQTTVDDLSSQLYMATYYKYMYDYQLTNGGELDDATKQEYTDKSAEYQTQIDDLQVQLDAAAAAGFRRRPTKCSRCARPRARTLTR